MVGGWRVQEEAEGSGGRLKLISRPPQLSTVFGELRHAYMWLIESGVWGRQVGVVVCSVVRECLCITVCVP